MQQTRTNKAAVIWYMHSYTSNKAIVNTHLIMFFCSTFSLNPFFICILLASTQQYTANNIHPHSINITNFAMHVFIIVSTHIINNTILISVLSDCSDCLLTCLQNILYSKLILNVVNI